MKDLELFELKFKNSSLVNIPLFVQDKEFQIGSDPERGMIELSVSDKKFIVSNSYYGTYLLHTISLLTRACCLNKPSKTTMQA